MTRPAPVANMPGAPGTPSAAGTVTPATAECRRNGGGSRNGPPLQRRREIERIVERHALFADGRRLRGKRLRRPRVLACDIARRHRTLLDRPDRLAGHAIEHEGKALLRQLDDGVDAAAVNAD